MTGTLCNNSNKQTERFMIGGLKPVSLLTGLIPSFYSKIMYSMKALPALNGPQRLPQLRQWFI